VYQRRERCPCTPVARSGLKSEALYAKPEAVDRINARLKTRYGFERHFIRGKAMKRLRCSLAVVVMRREP